MPTSRRTLLALACLIFAAPAPSRAQAPAPVTTLGQLARLGPQDLDRLYSRSGPGTIPSGRLRGRVLLNAGTAAAGPSRAFGRVMWQGKVFRPEQGTATNRFFGVRAVKGNVTPGTSWFDGRPATVLDYRGTSWVYGNVRDEIREVAPGLYLGRMYAVSPSPKFRMYFALETR